MSSFKDLDDLRRQNKELLQKLQHNSEDFQRLRPDCSEKPSKDQEYGSGPDRKSSRTSARAERPGGLSHVSGDLVKKSVSGKSPSEARSALWKHSNTTRTTHLAAASGCVTGQEEKPKILLQAQGIIPRHVQANPSEMSQTRESVTSQDKSQRVMSRVRLPPTDHELERVSESEARRVQPLLGYDWIAGLMDAENSLSERSEHFFTELRTFRQVNKEECVHSTSSGSERLPADSDLWPSSEDSTTKHECSSQIHQCTFCYRINSRLFAAPLDPQDACPVCKMPKEKHPHTEHEPAFIRVSIPRSTLLPAYRYKAHRRCSFDPSDSLGLPSHCLSGWTNISMGAGSKMSSLDLKSSMEIRPHPGTVPSAQEDIRLDLSGSRAPGSRSSDRLLDVSRLARYQFQHAAAATRNKPSV